MSKLDYNGTRINQLDRLLTAVGNTVPDPPKKGWISEIRTSLLLTTVHLAKRLGVDQSVISRLEKSEANQTITLSSLNKAAEALGCRVKYVLVPKTPLDEQLWKQAKKVLTKENKEVDHTMHLEQQETHGSKQLEQDIRAAILLHEKGGRIWDE